MSTTTTTTTNFAGFVAALDSVTVAQRATADKVIKAAGGLEAALSSYLKTGKASAARIGALAHVYKGVLEAFEFGQRNRLLGFATATKKSTDAFAFMRSIGIVSEAGAVLIGVSAEAKGAVKLLAGRAIDFIALALAYEGAAKLEREAAKATGEAAKATGEAEAAPVAEAEAEAAVIAPLTDGQKDDNAAAWIISRVAYLSEENREALLAALALVAAPVAEAAPVVAKKPRAKKVNA